MIISDVKNEEECCCSCKHNKRIPEAKFISCHCDVDGHYIGYVANFESVCKMWESAESEDV